MLSNDPLEKCCSSDLSPVEGFGLVGESIASFTTSVSSHMDETRIVSEDGPQDAAANVDCGVQWDRAEPDSEECTGADVSEVEKDSVDASSEAQSDRNPHVPLDQIFALLSLLFEGVEGEALFSCAGATFKSRDPDAIEKFIADATETVSVALVTCAGQAHALAYDCMSDEEIDAVVEGMGEPSAALTRSNEGVDEEPGAILIYRQAGPIAHVTSDDDEKLTDAIPLPGTGGWGLTAASVEKLLPSTQEASGEVEGAARSAGSVAEARTEPFVHNNAQFVGGDLPSSVMDLKIKLGTGRSANDKRWPVKEETTFFQFVNVMSKHVPGDKDGRAFLQGEAIDNERKAKAMKAMYIVGLDVDSGIQIDPVVKKIQDELGLAAIVYTTHSHLSTTTYVSQSAFAKFAKKHSLNSEPTDEAMRRYVREDRSWEQAIADTVTVEDDPKHISDGVQYVLHHDRIPKFRIIFPLAEPYVIAKQRMSQDDAIQLWKGKLLGLARILKIPIDESCLDPSRLFYFPRHKRDAEFAIHVTNGAALRFEEIPELMPRSKDRPTDDVFAEAAKALGANGRSLFIGDFSLRRWAGETANLFDIARLFRERADERIRHDDGQDKLEIECPFDSHHSNAGDPEDRACFVVSAHADGTDRGFAFGCQHNSCKRRDRLEFLAEAVESNWITVEDLKDETFRVFTVEEDEGGEKHVFDKLDKAVAAMNKVLAAVRVGTQQRYLVEDTPGRPLKFYAKEVVEQEFGKYRLKVENAKGETDYMPLLPLWRKHPKARSYKDVIFDPTEKPFGGADSPYFNLWEGWQRTPKKGSWKLLRRHLLEVICDGDAVSYKYLIAWLADMFQQPQRKLGVAIVLFGERGTGKSLLGEYVIKPTLGTHMTTVASRDAIGGKFNAHTQTALCLLSEEALWAGDKSMLGKLKHAITGTTALIEPKGIDPFEVRSFTRYIICSNEERTVPAESARERRFVVFNVSGKYAGNAKYFDAIHEELRNGGIQAFLYDMLAHDYSDVNLRYPPKTKGLSEQIAANLSPAQAWWQGVLESGEFTDREGDPISLPDADWEKQGITIAQSEVVKAYNAAVNTYGGKASAEAVTKFLKSVTNGALPDPRRIGGRGEQIRSYSFPSLPELRGAFRKATGVGLHAARDPFLDAGTAMTMGDDLEEDEEADAA